ncbi:MAG: SUMF1/EgtB/PvdO family nonheme iron enzyme [Blastochloris sp.]|nr:SUMF1/EgtB/PvdO family nonheme iron enzyme [Blastochloris sp.]
MSWVSAHLSVGVFPHGAAACGAEELAGNVWEWCATPYREYPLPEDFSPETLDTSDQRETYVLRGGSWVSRRSNARCGARARYDPDSHDGYFGFRVARLFSSGSS